MTYRAAVWWVLWRDNKADASRLCDEIVRRRPVPEALLADLGSAPLVRVEETEAQRWARQRGAGP